MSLTFTALSLSCLSAPAAAAAKRAREPFILYRVAKGDNLYDLARRHLRHTGDFRNIQRLNRIEDPRRIRIGTLLRIPRHLLRFMPLEARILAHRGPVIIRRGGRDLPVAVGIAAKEGDELLTGTGGFVSIGLPDRSIVSLPSQSRVELHRLRRLSLTGALERLFVLKSGRARAIVTPMNRDKDDFRFSTPLAVSAVRGTEFRIAYDDRRSTAEVLDGTVDFATNFEASRQSIGRGFGAIATDGYLSPPLVLLPPPVLVNPGAIQDGETLQFSVTQPTGSHSYRAQVAQDAGFIDTVSEAVSADGRFDLPPVPEGVWFVRVAAIDPNGLEGLPATFSFRRQLYRPGQVERRRNGDARHFLFRWAEGAIPRSTHRFQLFGQNPSLPIIDEPGLTVPQYTVSNLMPGTYRWRAIILTFEDGAIRQTTLPFEQLIVSDDEQ
ncbi:Peptidoglycan binding domain/FecR protein [uncultured Sphingopyxis sp.]|uniref:Peptidoglycan binding domain/FecR protein n=1 Tax=uncultured Sphingopyxis sp. TaxID=310581 RepID=A0A1Y5Q6E8_9SPHN|nr:FecR domain-containing protein [uncultured Sphingopyxis sp.]SBV35064.1 Peptidoglycan binding domain/FecR protein [uncultured Sphingopyxis sp.]